MVGTSMIAQKERTIMLSKTAEKILGGGTVKLKFLVRIHFDIFGFLAFEGTLYRQNIKTIVERF